MWANEKPTELQGERKLGELFFIRSGLTDFLTQYEHMAGQSTDQHGDRQRSQHFCGVTRQEITVVCRKHDYIYRPETINKCKYDVKNTGNGDNLVPQLGRKQALGN